MPRVREEVDLLRERGLHHVGHAGHDGAARLVHHVLAEARHVREDGEEDVLERLLRSAVLVEQQVVDVRLRDLRREARIDRAVFAALDPHLFVVGSLKTTFCFGMPSASK
jgi:hypothetical protein